MFFNNINDLDELKITYKKLCKKYHPDMGGKAELFIVLHNEYESKIKYLKDKHDNVIEEIKSDVKKPESSFTRKKSETKLDKTKTKYYRFFEGHESEITIILPDEAFDDGGLVLLMNRKTGDVYIIDMNGNTPDNAVSRIQLNSRHFLNVKAIKKK